MSKLEIIAIQRLPRSYVKDGTMVCQANGYVIAARPKGYMIIYRPKLKKWEPM